MAIDLGRIRICAVAVLMGVAAVHVTGCSPKKDLHAGVLAKVGNGAVTEVDFKAEVARRQRAGIVMPEKEALLQELILHEAMVQRARAEGVDRDPQVKRELDNLLIGKLMDRELQAQQGALTVSPAEVEACYSSNKVHYTRPAQTRLSILKLGWDPKATAEQKGEVVKRMAEAKAKVLAHPPRGRGPANNGFGALAIDYSDDQITRYRGGDIGWIEPGRFPPRFPPAVLDAGLALPQGKCSDPIPVSDGVYMVTKTDLRDAVVTPLSPIEPGLRQQLLNRKCEAAAAAFKCESLRLAAAEINQPALEALVMPVSREVRMKSENKPPVLPGASSESAN